MRIKGKLKSWNDDRGFGFIDPIEGGQPVFVHIKAFPRRGYRPQVDQLVWFEIGVGPEGKKRATNVEFVRRINEVRLERPPRRGEATLIAIPIFIALYIVIEFMWQPSLILAAIYIVVSTVTFFVYANDKAAAQRGARRTPEATLHLLAVLGGWPGALLAQQSLRHKSIKSEFRVNFWATVFLNVVFFIALSSPGAQFLLGEVIRSSSPSNPGTNPTSTRRR